ncbi:hypothetical protein ISS40_07900 [Candidatus Bathyarchaeota archaeon]|nr:hypothetical protein [Candidatus Bathyarchaeota archaeon]
MNMEGAPGSAPRSAGSTPELKVRKMDQKTKKMLKQPIVVLLLVAVIVGGVGAVYVIRYQFQTPASVTIGANQYKLGIYSDAACTLAVTTFTFGSLPAGDPSAVTVTSPEYYIKREPGPAAKSLWVSWDHDLTPNGETVNAFWRMVGTVPGDETEWPAGPLDGVPGDNRYLSPTATTAIIRFTVTAISAELGTVDFNVIIDSSDSIA